MKGIIDRFEDELVVIEVDGKTQDVHTSLVADDVKMGDVVFFQEGVWKKDEKATKERASMMKSLMNDVWED